MSEKSPSRKILRDAERICDSHDLLARSRNGIDTLSNEERVQLAKSGHDYLSEGSETIALDFFEAAQDFEGLRVVADKLLKERLDSTEIPRALILLEDHEGMRNLLNRESRGYWGTYQYEGSFRILEKTLNEYVDKFLIENGDLTATGMINRGDDLIAIRNLSRQYDVAVPIARGGLKQGAIAHLWGMPTKIVDIAAHNRKVPRGKWINPVQKKDFEGKKVLLFDKDAVSGASIRKALSMLARFRPLKVDAYFPYDEVPAGSNGTGTRIENLPPELTAYYPENAPLQNAGDVYIEAHEKLETPYGRRRKTETLFIEEAERIKKEFPELSESIRTYIIERCRLWDSLNPMVAGISDVREQMLTEFGELKKVYLNTAMYKLPGVVGNLIQRLSNPEKLPISTENKLIAARYAARAVEAATSRNIDNQHYPSNPLAAFIAAREAVQKGFDVALIVGPEGFAYEPFFIDLGLATVAVNIPESRIDETRTTIACGDLSVLKGKRVLIVEDDVRTGATLKKIIDISNTYVPQELGLYLGLPKTFQRMENIPSNFKDVFVADGSREERADFSDYLATRGLNIFKYSKD